jgi:hypothetical protein
MSSVLRLTGDDTVVLNQRVFEDFPHGEVAKLSFETDVATSKVGKNGNLIVASNASGEQASLELKVLRGSSDDAWLNNQLTIYLNAPSAYVLMAGSLVKKLGEGDGKVKSDTSVLSAGFISKHPDVVVNVEGDVEQAIATYTLKFGSAVRVIS